MTARRSAGAVAVAPLLLLASGALLFVVSGLAGPRARADFAFPAVSGIQLAADLPEPVHVTHAGDSRLFVTLRHGSVVIIKDGQVLPEPFFEIPVRSVSYEEGLLSVAFPAGYQPGDWFHLYRINPAGDIEIGRMRVSGANPDIAEPATYQVMLHVPHAGTGFHNGGGLAFGPGGYLYASTGDGTPAGSCGDTCPARPGTGSLLGRLLRIDPNTFQVQVMAAGLRNPWRFSFHDGKLYLADVGDLDWEELNVVPFDGAQPVYDFGWNIKEGKQCSRWAQAPCDAPGLTEPVFDYPSSGPDSRGCSIIGGDVFEGIYFFGDFCSGRIWGWTQAQGAEELERGTGLRSAITSFGKDYQGNLLIVFRGSLDGTNGSVSRLVFDYPPGSEPTPIPRPTLPFTPAAVFEVPGISRD